ncbi:MAG TPA: hypothetical protein VH639_21915 [Bryobacteraceae bacterium]
MPTSPAKRRAVVDTAVPYERRRQIEPKGSGHFRLPEPGAMPRDWAAP